MTSARAWASSPNGFLYYLSILTLMNTWGFNLGMVKLLREHMKLVVANAWAPRTRRTLSSQAKAFKEFSSLVDIQELPITGEMLCLYAIWLYAIRGLKAPKSITMYLSAVRTLHRRLDLPCHTPTSYGPLGQVVSGLKRLLKHKVKKASPITPAILVNLLKSCSITPLLAIEQQTLTTFRALTLLLFKSMLRSSNMIPENRHKFDPEYVLKWSNIIKVDFGVKFIITKSKTIQFGERSHEIPLAASPDTRFCPVLALESLAEMYGPEYVKPECPVFLVPTLSGKFVPVKKSEYLGWLRSRLRRMGLPAEDYGIHSFRHGSVSEALLNEDNRVLVQLASDHSSEAIMGYAQIAPERRMALSAKVNRSLSQF